jgi:hypothetical protein
MPAASLIDLGGLGTYRFSTQTGVFNGAVPAGATVFCCRWVHPTYLAVLTRFVCELIPVTALPVNLEVGLSAYFARKYIGDASGGRLIDLTGDYQKQRTNMPSSLMGQVMVANTNAITDGQWSLDPEALARTSGLMATVSNNAEIQYDSLMGSGQYPPVMQGNEGLVLQNLITIPPSSGSVRFRIAMTWSEAKQFP